MAPQNENYVFQKNLLHVLSKLFCDTWTRKGATFLLPLGKNTVDMDILGGGRNKEDRGIKRERSQCSPLYRCVHATQLSWAELKLTGLPETQILLFIED